MDQTTRIHAPWKSDLEFWYQISRPQIHGYALSTIAILGFSKYASGADEKIVRVFEASSGFEKNLKAEAQHDFEMGSVGNVFLPTFNLTNKYIHSEQEKPHRNSLCVRSDEYQKYAPPVEKVLRKNTLWPEIKKLYGHGFEIHALASRSDGLILATAAKAKSLEDSVIILWNTTTWIQSQKFFSHTLTVTQLAFSPNGCYLISVSRDRKWCLFTLQDMKYILQCTLTNKSFHKRVIWCCAWTHDSEYFATGSRDGRLCFWISSMKRNQSCFPCFTLLDKKTSITALSVAPLTNTFERNYIIAIGYENGTIDIGSIKKVYNKILHNWKIIAFLDQSVAHHLAIRKLAFRPNKNQKSIQLATCSDDSAVKIIDIIIQ